MTSDEEFGEKLRRSSERAGKSYGFSGVREPEKVLQYFFQESQEGLILFVIFQTMACRWNLCLGCNLPSVSSAVHVGYRPLMRQIDNLFAEPEVRRRKEEIRKCILSNNGSMLDEQTFSSTALMYLVARCNLELSNLRTMTLETRAEYVDVAELEFLARALAEGDSKPGLELAVGFEAFDDDIRNNHFLKGLTLATFEELVRRIAPFGFRLKTYFMQKPVPGMSDEAAVEDICRAIDYLSEIAARHGVTINMHLNPTFAARGTKLADEFLAGNYRPPRLRDVARAAAHARGKDLSIFIGLSDEGLAVEGGSYLDYDRDLVPALEEFNRTQDHALLASL